MITSAQKNAGGFRKLHCGFVTGWSGPWRNLKIRAKYALMRLQKMVYPDVFCIPDWLGGSGDFLGDGTGIDPERYDFILAELNAGLGQLQYVKELVDLAPQKVIVLPGPPEVFEALADPGAPELAGEILREAGQVWAYAAEVAQFADALAGRQVARITPWPFDYAETRRLGQMGHAAADGAVRVLIGAPLRFGGIAENAPHFLEECLAASLEKMAPTERPRFQFLGMVYTKEDERAWHDTGFGRQIGATLVPRKSYVRFLRFIADCDAVITLTRFGVLGRVTFLAAALERPGIFTDRSELNRRLYPHSLVRSPTDEGLRELVAELLRTLVHGKPPGPFRPQAGAAQAIGDFSGNARAARAMLNLPD